MTSVLNIMKRPEWLRCMPRISFEGDMVEIVLLRETIPSYYDVLWEKEFPVTQLEAGVREAYDAAMAHMYGEKS